MRPKFPPLFSRKLEEIKRRRTATTLSRKKLLREEDFSPSPPRHHSNASSYGEVDEASTASSNVIPDSESGPGPVRPHDVVSGGKVRALEINENKVEEAVNAMDETGNEQENDRLSNEEGSLLFPSSPSFRIYYIESLQNKNDNDDDDEDDSGGKDYKNGYLSDSIVDSGNTLESTHSTEESATTTRRRERKAMRLIRVFTMCRPVKCILNVRPCGCTGGINIPRSPLISTKSTTI